MSGLLLGRPWLGPGTRCKIPSARIATIPRYQTPCLLQIHCYTSPAPSSRPARHPRRSPPPTTNQLEAVIADHRLKLPSGSSKQTLYEAFGDHTAAGGAVSDHLGYSVVSTLLTPRAPDDAEFPDQVPDADKELALRVLEYLSLQGTPVLVMGTFAMLYQAAIFSPPPPKTTVDTATLDDDFFAPSTPASDQDDDDNAATTRISRMITALHLPYHPDDARSLMTMLFQNGDYETFWKLWRRIPLQGAPRRAEDYVMLFRLHAQLGDPRRAVQCVLMWVPMMAREDLPVSAAQGEVARLVVRCIEVAVGALEPVAEGRQLEQLMQIRDEAIQAAAMESKGENEHAKNR
ncbi:hypothetical protein BP00DRAFT_423558 [Aspergillus indologenus CBS 114.80]|uniref:ATPase synthesis protein 25 n=1 Tax=Aspergillus indologenus CBS 114.80 TaxID=1450541 RepID=A0A2V5IIK1_9EURO|nr:hypothetical protein BP00DRAFT_423558 [Aspergillus indologenus CBS 114.80]